MADLLRRVLDRRGIAPGEETEAFLNPRLGALAAAEELPGVVAAADEILAAVAAGRHIVVFGDFDCDGVSATAILVRTLAALGADVSPFLPERLTEGYGMTDAAVARMLADNPDVGLVVTVDNGINSDRQVRFLLDHGVAVVVTDHHLPGATLPECTIVNPRVAAPERLADLCGAAVAYFLARRLVEEAVRCGMYSGPRMAGPLLVLAGLATVTDVMPLKGQNRILVAEALRLFDAHAPAGLKALYEKAGRRGSDHYTSHDFGFLLGPRINAAGRVASGIEALELLLEDNPDHAREFAIHVDMRNLERKTAEAQMSKVAEGMLVAGAAAQVVDVPDGNPGVAGIVAARLMEKVSVPVGVVVDGRGSARAPKGYNLCDALAACSQHLDRFGGHALAAGFSVREGAIGAFRDAFAAACAMQREALSANGEPEDDVDLEVAADELQPAAVAELSRLEPYGEGNQQPLFRMRAVPLADFRRIGREENHLSFSAGGLRSMWWGKGAELENLRTAAQSSVFDVVFTPAVSTYGETHVELTVKGVSVSKERGEGQ